ncbi:cytochrome c [Allostella sp. ATCC 35155]|nr:cytochrome c [Stella sp. ATCC 35155]
MPSLRRLAASTFIAAAVAASPSVAQDAGRGEQVFKRACAVCHMVGPAAKNRVGPVLNGIVGRKAGTVAGFPYSPASRRSDVVWDDQTLAAYLRDPRAFMPGTRMIYAGLRNDRDLADLVAYLRRFDAAGGTR